MTGHDSDIIYSDEYEDISSQTVSERAGKYAETGASIQETMDELVRSGLVTDVNDLTQSEGVAISAAWYQGSLDYKAKQKKKAGEVGARGTGERAETTGQSVSGETGPANKQALCKMPKMTSKQQKTPPLNCILLKMVVQ